MRKIQIGDLLLLKSNWKSKWDTRPRNTGIGHPCSFDFSQIVLIPDNVFSIYKIHKGKSLTRTFFLKEYSYELKQKYGIMLPENHLLLLYLGYEELAFKPRPGDDDKLHFFLYGEQKMFTLLHAYVNLQQLFEPVKNESTY